MVNQTEILTITKFDIDELLERLDRIEDKLNRKEKPTDFDILTVAEACKFLRISEPTLYRHIRNHNLPAIKVGHQRRFRKSELIKWAESDQL